MEFKSVIRKILGLACVLIFFFHVSDIGVAVSEKDKDRFLNETEHTDVSWMRKPENIRKEKTLIISTDQLDLTQLKSLDIKDSAISLMSAKTARGTGSSLESQYMTIASGIRVTVDQELFTGVEKSEDNRGTEAIDFFNVLYRLNQDYDGFIDKFKFLGEIFHDNGLKTAYIGDDSSILLAADKEGKVDYGELGVVYDYKELRKLVDRMSSNAQLTVLSYNIEDNYERLDTIKKITEKFDGTVYIIPKMISGDISVRNNSTIKPILIKGIGDGVLDSRTTKRYGLVSNLDIMPTILSKYGIEYDGQVGKRLEVIEGEKSKKENVEDIEFIFNKYMNLTSVKYSFNAMIIYLQIALIILYLITGRSYRPLKYLLYIPIYSILLSLIFGNKLAEFDRNVYVYSIMAAAAALSIITHMVYIRTCVRGRRQKKENTIIEKLSIIAFIMIVAFIIFLPEQIYSSFVGYNNLVAGGRFFGFNNDVMGTLIGSFILAYFYIRKNKSKMMKHIITLGGVGLLLISLSGRYGSNFGGLVTATVLSLLLIYGDLLINTSKRMKVVAGGLVLIGLVLGIIVMTRGGGNHISEFASRVQRYGMEEFVQMVSKKFYQVIVNTRKMPWILAILMQLTFMFRRVYSGTEQRLKDITVLFIFISIIALLTNDTGVVALVYMNTIIISSTLLKISGKDSVRM